MLDLYANFTTPYLWIVILGAILLFFGGQKIPELMRGVGRGASEFKKGLEEGKTDSPDDKDDKNKGGK